MDLVGANRGHWWWANRSHWSEESLLIWVLGNCSFFPPINSNPVFSLVSERARSHIFWSPVFFKVGFLTSFFRFSRLLPLVLVYSATREFFVGCLCSCVVLEFLGWVLDFVFFFFFFLGKKRKSWRENEKNRSFRKRTVAMENCLSSLFPFVGRTLASPLDRVLRGFAHEPTAKLPRLTLRRSTLALVAWNTITTQFWWRMMSGTCKSSSRSRMRFNFESLTQARLRIILVKGGSLSMRFSLT